MDIKVKTVKNVTVVSLAGNLTLEDAEALRVRLRELIGKGNDRIAIDLSGSDYISSIGLSSIAEAKKKAIVLKGDIKIAGSSALVKKLFESTSLSKDFEMYDTVEEAIASFR